MILLQHREACNRYMITSCRKSSKYMAKTELAWQEDQLFNYGAPRLTA